MSVKVTTTLQTGWLPDIETTLDAAVAEMATDILRRADINAPKLTGALSRDGKVHHEGDAHYVVTFGETVPYARIREFENRKHPSTIGYLANAGDTVGRGDITKYLRSK